MPARISCNTKRNIIFYTPLDTHNPDREPTRLSKLNCLPTRRSHSPQIPRLLLSNTPPHQQSSERTESKNIAARRSAKLILEALLTSLSLKFTTNSFTSAKTDSPTSHDSRSEQERPIATEFLADESLLLSPSSISPWSYSNLIPSLSLLCEDSWRADTMPAHGSSAGLNCGTAGLLHPIASQKGTQDLEKPLDSGNGVSCSIILAEPVIFLMGIDHDRTSHDSQGANATTLLRGILRLNVTKAAKIKSISLRFSGRARTIWPEGIPPQKQDVVEEIVLQSELMPFFNAFNCNSEHSYGDLCIHTSRDSKSSAFSVKSPTSEVQISPQQVVFSLPGISNRASKHGPGSSAPVVPSALSPTGDQILSSTQVKGYKVFYPGLYDYSFEMPIDSNMPESTNLPLASVKWELEACVERAGAFKANLSGKREVPIIRSPSQDFLELVEPIAVSRTWDHQLHYEIIISGKSFPIGTKIPIAFKLTPLAKVQVHKLKVFLSEKIDYFAKDRTVQRRDRKISILLLKKCAGKPLAKEFWPSEVKVLGGERTPEEREVRRTLAIRRRETEALQNNTFPEPLPEPADNLLGDIDLGMEEWWGPTEIEMNVQLPTCEDMERDRSKRLAHDCTWKNVHVHHWLKVQLRNSNTFSNKTDSRIDSYTSLPCRH